MRAVMSLYILCLSKQTALPAGCDICESPGPLLLAYNPHSYLIFLPIPMITVPRSQDPKKLSKPNSKPFGAYLVIVSSDRSSYSDSVLVKICGTRQFF